MQFLLSQATPVQPNFDADGPVWKMLGYVFAGITFMWSWQEYRRYQQDKKDEERKDAMMAVDIKFKDEVAAQLKRGNDILQVFAGSQESHDRTLTLLVETQAKQGETLDKLLKSSAHWGTLAISNDKHVHIESPKS